LGAMGGKGVWWRKERDKAHGAEKYCRVEGQLKPAEKKEPYLVVWAAPRFEG